MEEPRACPSTRTPRDRTSVFPRGSAATLPPIPLYDTTQFPLSPHYEYLLEHEKIVMMAEACSPKP